MAIETNRSVFYPRLIRRVRAILVDSIILPVVMFGFVMVGSAAGVSDGYAKFALLIVPIFVLEPAMVAVTGGTIGHHLLGVRGIGVRSSIVAPGIRRSDCSAHA